MDYPIYTCMSKTISKDLVTTTKVIGVPTTVSNNKVQIFQENRSSLSQIQVGIDMGYSEHTNSIQTQNINLRKPNEKHEYMNN